MLSTTGLQTIFIWPEHRCSLFVFLLLFWLWQHFLLDGLKVKNRIHYHPILFYYPHIVLVFLQKTSWCCLWHFLFDLFCSDKPFVGASVGYFLFLFLLAGRALTVSYIDLTSFKLWIFMIVFSFVLFLVVLPYLHLHYSITYFLQVLLSPPIVVYSPRVLPVYVYDAHADCGKNVRFVECPVLFFLSF